MPYLDRDGDVHILYLGNKGETDNENRFHPDYIEELHATFDEVEAIEGRGALVTTATGKFYSNGLHTDWMFANFDRAYWYLDRVHSIFTRLLTFPMATVAAVNGHAFGAGAMMATSHDHRVMRADRGFYSLPEVLLGMPFTVAMNALITSRFTNQAAVSLMTTGRRVGGVEAKALGIVDATANGDAVLADAIKQASEFVGNRGENLVNIKTRLHGPLLAALATETNAENLPFGK
jgi:Delta3-Delta2-enoyl-CoA isomerase